MTTAVNSTPMPSRAHSESPVPSAVQISSLCSSEADSEDERKAISQNADTTGNNKAGIVSPHTICHQRSLSAAVVTKPDAQHEYLEGRPKIVLQSQPLMPPTLHRSQTLPTDTHQYTELTSNPHPMRLDAWSEAFAPNFNVRSSSYLNTSKKCPSQPALFKLLTVDLVRSNKPNIRGMCAHPQERVQLALRKEQETGRRLLPEFIFAVNLCVPATGSGKQSKSSGTGESTGGAGGSTDGSGRTGGCYHCVFYFGLDDKSLITDATTPVGRLGKEFFFGSSDEFRNQTFKLIPRIADGNFVVRKAVGSKPSLLGNKLKQHYIRTERYMELIADIGSSPVAQRIVKLALGYAKTLTVDMMFLLEGTSEATLPEQILGGVRIKNVDFKKKDGQRVMASA